MKKKISILVAVIVAAIACLLLASCSNKGAPPYENYEKEGFTVHVRYDAGDGFFASSAHKIVVDSYNVSNYTVNENGKVSIKLNAPDDKARGDSNTFTPSNPKYFFAGWYKVREVVKNGEDEVLDINGNKVYTYSERWDFKNGRLEVDPNYTPDENGAAVTLYAAWIPEFTFKFCDFDGGVLGTYSFDPMYSKALELPTMDEKTGKWKLHKFPDVEGKTFSKVYLDPAGKEPVTLDKVTHTGQINLSNATATGNEMTLYVDYLDGEWISIYTADQFNSNVALTGNYIICNDLDFEGEDWNKLLMYGDFAGTINGNGYSLKNISATQSDFNEEYAGLFGTLTAGAKIMDLNFENVSFTIGAGYKSPGGSYGLFAGAVDGNAVLENVNISGMLYIGVSSYIKADTAIGLLCGEGDIKHLVDYSAIGVEALYPDSASDTPIKFEVIADTVIISAKKQDGTN